MRKNIFILLFILTSVPALTFAMGGTGGAGGTGGTVGGTTDTNKITWKITNPLKIGSDIPSIIDAVMKGIVMPIASVLVVLAILYSGFKFVVAQGNPKEIEEARRGLVWALVGSAILLGAYGISTALRSTVGSIVDL